MAGPYGTAWDVAGVVHPTFRSITSNAPGDLAARRILANAVARTLDTPPGSLPDAPGRGYSLDRLILLEITPEQLDAEAAQMADQIALDERVISADVSVEQIREPGGITARITIEVTPDFDGPFRFTINASQAALEIVL